MNYELVVQLVAIMLFYTSCLQNLESYEKQKNNVSADTPGKHSHWR